VVQPQVLLRLPCYDFTPVADVSLDACPLRRGWPGGFRPRRLPWCDGRCVQGPGTDSPRRADPRLLAIPASRSRVADCDPNWGGFWGFAPPRGFAARCRPHCNTCVALGIRAMMT